MNADLTLALDLADLADRISAERFRAADLVVETKPDMTPVSEADRAIERALRERLAVVRPGHAIVGEEEGVQGDGDWRWIIDPIDGTKNFVRGIPIWGTLIALEREGTTVVGVASAPALQRRWWAARGEGAFADGRPIHVSKVERLGDAQLSLASIESWARHGRAEQITQLIGKVWRSRGFGDFWQHVLVAEGAVDVAVEPEVSLWDLAALQVIVEEAGGQFTDLDGVARADGGTIATSNGLLHDEILAILRG
jgi:histidinol-phosphatase